VGGILGLSIHFGEDKYTTINQKRNTKEWWVKMQGTRYLYPQLDFLRIRL